MRKSIGALVMCATLAAVSPVVAGALPTPTGDVILEVTGGITNTTDGSAIADFDLSMLDRLDSYTIVTKTPWYDGERSFSGPLGSAFLEAVGAVGTMMTVTAINDYVTEIPVSDFLEHRAILATRLDGELMSVRDKGPIFIVYPFDAEPELNNETYFGRSSWQVKSIEVH